MPEGVVTVSWYWIKKAEEYICTVRLNWVRAAYRSPKGCVARFVSFFVKP